MPWVFPSVPRWVLLCTCFCCLFLSDVSVVSVSLACHSCPDVLSWIRQHFGIHSQVPPPPSPLPNLLLNTQTHTHIHTKTSTISRDKLGFCDFLQIAVEIRPCTDREISTKEALCKPEEKKHTYKSQSCNGSCDGLFMLEHMYPIAE